MEKQILKALKKVIDPELGINIVDLGLIYKVEVKENKTMVLMTLTSQMCPYGQTIISSVKEKVKKVKGIKAVNVKVTFTPPWSYEKISKVARLQLGL